MVIKLEINESKKYFRKLRQHHFGKRDMYNISPGAIAGPTMAMPGREGIMISGRKGNIPEPVFPS
jgi:hypothetical protein